MEIYTGTLKELQEIISEIDARIGYPNGKGTQTAAEPRVLNGDTYWFAARQFIKNVLTDSEKENIINHTFEE
tara:strand:+ start:1355 stop:1570 length:216 start_codon:yes stop_codon:yes gene_type:complete